MREIKFRGLPTSFYSWKYGDLTSDVYGKKRFIETNKEGNRYCSEVRPKTVGQFTGLKDKNGKDIYEGDILKCKGYEVVNKKEMKECPEVDELDIFDLDRKCIMPITKEKYFNNEVQWWSGNDCGWRLKNGRFTCMISQTTIHNMNSEIVGNIHETNK